MPFAGLSFRRFHQIRRDHSATGIVSQTADAQYQYRQFLTFNRVRWNRALGLEITMMYVDQRGEAARLVIEKNEKNA